MKNKIILFALILSVSWGLQAQSGIEFTQKPWAEILKKAEKENKLIFLDAYASWCGPCKQMSKNVFTKEEVGKMYNGQFVNAKIDMEKGEGVNLARKYKVMAYPTYLFLDSQGEIVHRAVGYFAPDKFLELGASAMDPTRQLASLDEMYENGERDEAFLHNYAIAKYAAMDGSHEPIAEEYLKTQGNWGTKKNMEFIYQFLGSADSKMFDYLIENKAAFIEAFGERAVGGKIQNLIQTSLYGQKGDPIKKAEKIFPKVYPERAPEMISGFKMMYYRGANDMEKFVEAAKDHYSTFEVRSWDELNEIAWTFYEGVDNKKHLKQAVKWAKQSIEMDNNFYNNDTLAALYYKLKKKKKAIAAANKAIYLAKEEGEDTKATEELLEQIKGL